MIRKKLAFALCAAAVIAAACGFVVSALPDAIFVERGGEYSCLAGTVRAVRSRRTATGDNGLLSLFGVVPLKGVRINETQRVKLTPAGIPFGIKLLTDGVIVVGLGELDGGACPAKRAGLRVGDIINTVGGVPVLDNHGLASVLASSGGAPVNIAYTREGIARATTLTPVLSGGEYRAGMWVRDSTAGLGTLTYFDAESGVSAGLGHAVSDTDSGVVMPVASGELVYADIVGIKRGAVGAAGELRGTFSSGAFARLVYNGETGVFGEGCPDLDARELPIAFRHEVKRGKAYILATLDGDTPKSYDVSIERVYLSDRSPTKNLVIKITDKRLIEKTGGIVQGMSGCPIIQNGRLVGAVTHVFVNDPTRGYAIFIENMLYTQSGLSLKPAA